MAKVHSRIMTAIPAASWHRILDELRRDDAGLIRAWLYDLAAPDLAGGVMTVRARNEAQLRHLERCRAALARCAQVVLDRLVSLNLRLDREQKDSDAHSAECYGAELRPEFTLDQFVAAPENQLAHAAALRFLNENTAEYNPLFIHGAGGVGKTHLLQAVCSRCNSNGLHQRALYMTAQRFVAEFTECFEIFGPGRFRERFTGVHLVALDDVEFFSGKARSQEELFHVINGLLTDGKRLALASDRPPATIPEIEPRLAGRFGAGLVIAIDSPAAETRLRIIERKNCIGAFEFPKEALRQIAERCSSRDLDRVLARLDEVAQDCRGPFTMDLVHEVFRTPASESLLA